MKNAFAETYLSSNERSGIGDTCLMAILPACRAGEKLSMPLEFQGLRGCESIVARHVATCPNCHGYRFNCEEDEIVTHARLLASRPQTSVTESDMH